MSGPKTAQEVQHEFTKVLVHLTSAHREILEKFRDTLDQIHKSILVHNNSLEQTYTKTALVTGKPAPIPMQEVATHFHDINEALSNNNREVAKLQTGLELIGKSNTPSAATQSALEATTGDMTRKNELLVNIHKELNKHAMIVGKLSAGVTNSDKMRAEIEAQIKPILQITQELKNALKGQRQILDKANDEIQSTPKAKPL